MADSMTMVHIRASRRFVATGGEYTSPDERGTRLCGYEATFLGGDINGGTAETVTLAHGVDPDAAARWYASFLVGVILPVERTVIDLGVTEWTRRDGTAMAASIIGIVGPTELRVELRYRFERRPRPGALGRTDSHMVASTDVPNGDTVFADNIMFVGNGSRANVACRWHVLPDDVAVRARVFLTAARSLLTEY